MAEFTHSQTSQASGPSESMVVEKVSWGLLNTEEKISVLKKLTANGQHNDYINILAGTEDAGIAIGGPLRYLDIEIYKKQFDVNLFGLINVTKAFLDLLIESNNYPLKNKIINIGSISGKRSYPFVGPYTASKFALEGLTDSLRRELLIHDVDVVLIEPGPIKTSIWSKIPDIEDNPFLKTEYEIPLRKLSKGYIEMGKKGLHPDVIGDKIVYILQTNKPKTRYVITPNKLMNYLVPGFLPDRWVDKILSKVLDLSNKKSNNE